MLIHLLIWVGLRERAFCLLCVGLWGRNPGPHPRQSLATSFCVRAAQPGPREQASFLRNQTPLYSLVRVSLPHFSQQEIKKEMCEGSHKWAQSRAETERAGWRRAGCDPGSHTQRWHFHHASERKPISSDSPGSRRVACSIQGLPLRHLARFTLWLLSACCFVVSAAQLLCVAPEDRDPASNLFICVHSPHGAQPGACGLDTADQGASWIPLYLYEQKLNTTVFTYQQQYQQNPTTGVWLSPYFHLCFIKPLGWAS